MEAMFAFSKNRLIQELKTSSLKTGETFCLSSGQTSNIYIDVKKTMLSFKNHHLISQLLINAAALFEPYQAAAGVVLGGCHLASIVGLAAQKDVLYIRKEAKNHGTQNLIERPSVSSGNQVILFEDVITTGTSAIKAADILTKHNYTVQGIISVVDRRVEKTSSLGNYSFTSLICFDELI